jgi:hypothetical protein
LEKEIGRSPYIRVYTVIIILVFLMYMVGIFFFLVAPTLGSLLPLLEHRAEFPQFFDQGQSVGLLGWVIGSSRGLYLYTNIEKRTHMDKD